MSIESDFILHNDLAAAQEILDLAPEGAEKYSLGYYYQITKPDSNSKFYSTILEKWLSHSEKFDTAIFENTIDLKLLQQEILNTKKALN